MSDHTPTAIEMQRDLFAFWIARQPKPPIDHACSSCTPGGGLVIDGFVCAYHQAVAISDSFQ